MKTFLCICGLCFSALAYASPDLDATDLNKLVEMVGQDVSVVGIVNDVGSTSTDSIRFINVGLPKKQGFTAVIFQRNFGAFPDGMQQYKGKNVRIKGRLELYNGQQPQIELLGPDQIEILTE